MKQKEPHHASYNWALNSPAYEFCFSHMNFSMKKLYPECQRSHTHNTWVYMNSTSFLSPWISTPFSFEKYLYF